MMPKVARITVVFDFEHHRNILCLYVVAFRYSESDLGAPPLGGVFD